MHGRIWLAGVAVLLLAGCAEETGEPVPVRRGEPIRMTAASAGGACRLLDFAVIERHAGVRFDIAAASDRGDTHTCVVRTERAALPELTLTVTETSMDAPAFTAGVLPDGAQKLSKLGQAAYRQVTAASRGNGPVAQVGWLGTDGRLATLDYTCPKGTDRAAADELAGKLAALARTVNTRAL